MYEVSQIKAVFEKLISGNEELTELFFEEADFVAYGQTEDCLPYVDIGIISRYIVEKKIKNETDKFQIFFDNVEEIYHYSDSEIKDFLIIGLFEGIQNIGSDKIDYYFSFNQWLGKESQIAWDNLIDYWEGQGWRLSNEKTKRNKK